MKQSLSWRLTKPLRMMALTVRDQDLVLDGSAGEGRHGPAVAWDAAPTLLQVCRVHNTDGPSLLLQTSLLRPDRLVEPDAWIGHIPFAFWIIAAHRPRVLVELGTHIGNSYRRFCQAVATDWPEHAPATRWILGRATRKRDTMARTSSLSFATIMIRVMLASLA